MKLAGVELDKNGRVHYFQSGDLKLEKGDMVVVDAEKGITMGTVVVPPKKEKSGIFKKRSVRDVIRKATAKDIKGQEKWRKKEKEAFAQCLKLIAELKLPMKLVEAEYLLDGSKAIFYFTAEHRIDFRQLVRRLAAQIKTRIEMRQIGVRDEAKRVGGIGCCGRELCCAAFLQDFELVSIKMAKEQQLPLNPAKISGLCGRLMCCLSFEVDTYQELKKNLPKVGKKVTTKYGEGKVIRHNLLLQTITLELASGGVITINNNEL
ncbi:MAG: stage 0 sporulation family protein [Deltaproteobacteria bacterium]|nr:stage 0 sporulation family protein [Deltaproteobacteria bacterium]